MGSWLPGPSGDPRARALTHVPGSRSRVGRPLDGLLTAASSPVRGLHEQTNPRHRLRVEHDAHTLLIHLSDEDGTGWTAVAVDRATRQRAVAQHPRQVDAACGACNALYDE